MSTMGIHARPNERERLEQGIGRSLAGDEAGHVVIPAIVLLIALAAIIGGIYDWRALTAQRAELKAAANAAALDGAQALGFDSTTPARVDFSAKAVIASRLGGQSFDAITDPDFQENRLGITLSAPANVRFPGPLSLIQTVDVTSQAALLSAESIVCMVARPDPKTGATGEITLAENAKLDAGGCVIHSDADHEDAIVTAPTATLAAAALHRAAGDSAHEAALDASSIQVVPNRPDVLAGLPAPDLASSACDHSGKVVTGRERLSGGVYCGGLTVDGGTALLRSGTYIIRDGPLAVLNDGRLKGASAGFYLMGKDAVVAFDPASNIALSAPKSGEMAGLLIRAAPQSDKRVHRFASDDARKLTGTIYLPGDRLEIEGADPTANRSDFTVVVAGEIALARDAHLTLRTSYGTSDVPVANGLGPVKQAIPTLVSVPAG
ncbi:MAG: hypothetical protein AAGJ32_12655 [Pseudomonadota bacterium]